MAEKKSQSLPDEVMTILADADKKSGLPQGTMFAVLQQEVGGNASKYLQDPAAYHYGLNDKGQRIAGHTGKVSTAFGPFGILESTAKDPGFGVAPLKDKSFGEQARFAADYLAARSKKGGLVAGLAGYGEGAKYGQQVADRIGNVGEAPSQKAGARPADLADLFSPDDSYVEPMVARSPQQFEMPAYKAVVPPTVEEWDALRGALGETNPVSALSAYGQEPGNSYASLLGSLSSLASGMGPDFEAFLPRKGKA